MTIKTTRGIRLKESGEVIPAMTPLQITIGQSEFGPCVCFTYNGKDYKTRKWSVFFKMPSVRTMQKWSETGIARSPTGHKVEPDGTGPDGVPSWLLILGMI